MLTPPSNVRKTQHPTEEIAIPDAFAEGIIAQTGYPGTVWLRNLPNLARQLMEGWDLQPAGEVLHGFLGIVLPVRSRESGSLGALKISQPAAETDNQKVALEAWNGQGMVRLLASAPKQGALLLELLDHSHSLTHVPIPDAVEQAGLLLRRLSIPSEADLPTLTEHVSDWPQRWIREARQLGDPLPSKYLGAAREACVALAPQSRRLLVDHDLHYANVLAGEREPWIAVDPRGLLGDPEFAVGPLIWTRFQERDSVRRLDHLVETAHLDRDRAHGWLLVRAVDYFLWSTKAGLTLDPAACRSILDRLLQ